MKNKTLMKILSAFLAVVMVLSSAPLSGFVGIELPDLFSVKAEANTYRGSCGKNVYWSLDTETGVLEITGTGAMYEYTYSSKSPWYSYRNYIKIVNISENVTKIGEYAFWNSRSLTDVYYTGDIESWCGIEFVDYHANPMYYADNFHIDNTLVKEIVIPDTITEIKDYAFYNFKGITSVTISDSVTSIGCDAFYGCTSLTSVYYTGDIESWCDIEFVNFYSTPMCYAKNFYINSTFVKEIVIPDTVTEIKDYTFCDFDNLNSVTIPDSITSIGERAFYDCTSLASVTIPDSVASIGGSAFYKCTSLENVYYTGDIESWCGIEFYNAYSNPMYYAKNFYINNTLVKEIVIPDTVTEIKDYAFYSFEGITSVTIGNGVTSIGDYAFSNCTSLTSVTIGNSVESIGGYAFYDCDSLTSVTIPDSVESIGFGAFYDCTSLASVTIDKSVTSIGDYAFYDCTSLVSVTIGNGVTSIGDYAFYDCTSLASVTIGKSVTSIGDYAFCKCTSLVSVTIGNGVTSIGDYAFYDCESLTDVYYTGDIESWCNISFANSSVLIDPSNPVAHAENFYINDTLVTEIVIPDTVTEIKDYAFYGFEGITSVTIGDSVTSIGKYAFWNSRSLTNVYYTGDIESWCGIEFDNYYSNPMYYAKNFYINNTLVKEIVIPDTVTEIKYYAFYSFEGITSVTIPDNVTSIGDYAFRDCTSLTSVTIGDSVERIGELAFRGCDNIKTVFYNGTKQQWENITFDSNNTELTSSTIYFSGVHDHVYTEEIIQTPTCTKEGEITYTCSVCGDVYAEKVPALSHTESAPVEENRVNAVCISQGSCDIVVYCAECKEEISRETIVIPALGHIASDPVEENRVEANCVKEGSYDTIVYCVTCSAELSRKTTVIPTTGHTKLTPVAENRVEPTCVENGSYDSVVYCSVCKTELSRETKPIPAKGHTWSNWVVVNGPTETENGVKTRTCSVCGEKETASAPKTGITVTLKDKDGYIIKEVIISGETNEITFTDVEYGEYTVTVSKETYATRTYTVSVTDGEILLDFSLNKTGDTNGDGKVNTVDVAKANAHAKGMSTLSGYDLACVDINGDGKVNTVDVAKMNAHAKGVTTLW